ncbi:MAG: DUF1799 domain-containing protein [Rubrivivax sp.]|nr:DUF1799 domain-containing protein [Rubrivivax sp.]
MYLWPENVPAWHCWGDLQTQWRSGMAGATGLDYTAVRAYFDEVGLQGDERRDVFACIREAERAVLQAMAARRERDRDRAARGG